MTKSTQTAHVVQFTTLADFIADLQAGQVAGIYHNLHQQRVSAIPQYGISNWLLVTVIRALVAEGPIVHTATLTIPHGRAVEHIYGKPRGPADEADEPNRWQRAREQHDVIITELLTKLYDDAGGEAGLINRVRAGILDVPADLPLVLAAHPYDELANQQEAPAPSD